MENGFKKSKRINPESGGFLFSYTYMGEECLRVPMSSRLCEQLVGYYLIEKDLRSVITWMTKIREMHPSESSHNGYIDSDVLPNRELVKALFVAAISFYGKCFTVGRGRRVKLDDPVVPKNLLEVHEEAMRLRHNYVSHSGEAGVEAGSAVFVRQKEVASGGMINYWITVEVKQPDLMYLEDEGRDLWLELFEGVRENVNKKISVLYEKIRGEEVMQDAAKFFGSQAK